MPRRFPIVPGVAGGSRFHQTIVVPSGAGGGGNSGGEMSIFVASSGWLTDDHDATDGYVVLAIYNLPPGAAVVWNVIDLDDGGSGLFEVAGCLTDSVLVLHAPHEQPAVVTVSASVNGDAVASVLLSVNTNHQVCA